MLREQLLVGVVRCGHGRMVMMLIRALAGYERSAFSFRRFSNFRATASIRSLPLP
jgi:hypothetical protein